MKPSLFEVCLDNSFAYDEFDSMLFVGRIKNHFTEEVRALGKFIGEKPWDKTYKEHRMDIVRACLETQVPNFLNEKRGATIFRKVLDTLFVWASLHSHVEPIHVFRKEDELISITKNMNVRRMCSKIKMIKKYVADKYRTIFDAGDCQWYFEYAQKESEFIAVCEEMKWFEAYYDDKIGIERDAYSLSDIGINFVD